MVQALMDTGTRPKHAASSSDWESNNAQDHMTCHWGKQWCTMIQLRGSLNCQHAPWMGPTKLHVLQTQCCQLSKCMGLGSGSCCICHDKLNVPSQVIGQLHRVLRGGRQDLLSMIPCWKGRRLIPSVYLSSNLLVKQNHSQLQWSFWRCPFWG